MKKYHFTIPSSDGRTTLHGIRWIPEGEVRGVLQLVHGMVEHIERYQDVAESMVKAGFAVLGHDHLGHGTSVCGKEEYGFFAEENGALCLIRDMHRVTVLAKHLYPDVPLFILGHSMGSFLLRRYLTRYGSEVDGAIICGTGNIRGFEVKISSLVADLLCRRHDPHYRSNLLNLLVMGQYVTKFGNAKRPGSWLSKNEESVAEYAEDERCGFSFSVGAYQDFFVVLDDLQKEKDFDRIPRELPILFLSGMDDPLGGFTKKVLQVYNRFVELGMQDVDIFLYPDDRHEVLHELDREQVHADLLAWIEKRL